MADRTRRLTPAAKRIVLRLVAAGRSGPQIRRALERRGMPCDVSAQALAYYRRQVRENGRKHHATCAADGTHQESQMMNNGQQDRANLPAASEPWPDVVDGLDAFLTSHGACNVALGFIETAARELAELHQDVKARGFCSREEAAWRTGRENIIRENAGFVEQRRTEIEAFPLFASGHYHYGRPCAANALLETLELPPLHYVERNAQVRA